MITYGKIAAVMLAAGLAIGATGTAVQGQQGVQVTPEASYSCDTPSNRLSAWREALGAGDFALRGTVTAKLLRRGRVSPSGAIALFDADGRNGVTIQMIADDPTQEAAKANIIVTIDGNSTTGLAGTANTGTPVPFMIAARGTTTSVSVGNETLSFPVDLSGAKRLALSCTTGEFAFAGMVRG